MLIQTIRMLLLLVGLAAWVISQKWTFGQLKWTNRRNPFSFWGTQSDKRKYKLYNPSSGPRFPLSTTWLVFCTDGYHLSQFIALRCVYAMIALGAPDGGKVWAFLGISAVGSLLMWAYQEMFGV